MKIMQRSAASLAIVLLLGFASTPALPQARPAEHPVIRPGQAINGNLLASDPSANGRGAFKVFRFDASEGQRYLLTMRSQEFDAYLSVARTVGGITDVLESDDDSGGGTDARLRFRAPASGSYLVIAQSLDSGGIGAFTLHLENAPPPSVARPVAVPLGQTVRGALTETSPLLEDDSRYDLYTFTGHAGQRVVVTMRSQDFDAYLHLGRELGGAMEELASNDDGGGGTDARIRIALPTDGTYRIHASGLGTESLGSYALTVEEAPPVALRPAQPLRVGVPVHGELLESDPQADDDAFYVDWTYAARAGERLHIVMRSEAFDTFLSIGRGSGGEFHPIASNDDGPDGTDSLLEVTLAEAGTYTIRATSLMGGYLGPYTLQLDQAQ
jgi:hypothetical protein